MFLTISTMIISWGVLWLARKGKEHDTNAKKVLKNFHTVSSFKNPLVKNIDIGINFTLYLLIENPRKKKTDSKKNKIQTEKSLVLTSLIVKHTSKSNTLAYLFSIAGLVLYILGAYVGLFEKGLLVPFLSIVFIIIIFIKQLILAYRIKSGQYGSNEYEAREIVNFILDETNKHYFNGGDGQPVIFTDENLKELQQSVKGFIDGGVRV